MKKIPLGNDRFAIVDDEDYDFLTQWQWNALPSGNTFYAQRKSRKKTVYMHRLILGITDPKIKCDHINRNGLDNTQANLREATHTQNCINSIRKPPASGIRGVFWSTHNERWVAHITVNKKLRTRYFINKEDAIKCRKEMEVEFFGEFNPIHMA